MLVLVVFTVLGLASSTSQIRSSHSITISPRVIEDAARDFARQQNQRYTSMCKRAVKTTWNYHTNATQIEWNALRIAKDEFTSWSRESWEQAVRWKGLLPNIEDPEIARQIRLLSVLGAPALPRGELRKYTRLITEMKRNYDSTAICRYDKPRQCDLTFDKGLNKLFRRSRDYHELQHAWEEWREKTGKIRPQYEEFVQLSNKVAVANDFDNMAEMSIARFESNTFQEDMEAVWNQVKPLYEQIHAYTRRKLREIYGSELITERGPLPAHLLGNMWAHKWNIDEVLIPFPDNPPVDVTEAMKKKGYTPRMILEQADNFFRSLNMSRVPASFWRNSLMQVVDDQFMDCQPSAWDFCDGKDFRMIYCSRVTQKDLVAAHEKMTHIQHFMQYKDQPYIYRTGANSGIQEALGYAVALSAGSPHYLWRIGLLDTFPNSFQDEMNSMMRLALEKVVFLPYAHLVDLWRWQVLDGTLREQDWNCGWWDLRHELQGIKPPNVRTERNFDPASKYHIPANIDYTRHFVSTVMQFQIHKALCLKSGEYVPGDPTKPLYKCEISSSTEAGNALKETMKLGSSKPWRDVIESITGEQKLDATALLEYFEPLEKWLRENNKENNEFVGWRADGEYCLYKKKKKTGPPTRFGQDGFFYQESFG